MTTRSSSESLPLGQETISRFTINKTKTTPGPTAEEVQAIIKAATAHEVLSDGNLQQSVESPEKKFHGMRKYGVAHDLSTFGTHLGGGLTTKRSDSSGYASGGSCSEFDSWGSSPGNQGLAALKEFHSHPDLTDRPQFGESFRKILVNEVDIKNHKEMKEGKVKKGKKQPVVPEVEEPNPLDKVDCDTWFSEYTYGHLLPNTTPADVEYPTEEFINRLERRNRPPNFVKKVMPLLFGKSHKSPAEVVKNLREVLILVDKGAVHDKKLEKALEEISKNVSTIKAFIYGNDSAEPSSEHIIQVAQLAQEVYNANVLPMLVKLLPRFDFECKKDVGQIFNNLLRRQIGTRSPTVEYLGARPEILLQLVQGYSQPDIALTCGNMLRESIRHDHLAKIILYSDVFYTFFKYVQSEVFDIASDAFSTFKDLTTRHKVIAAEFLDANYDIFFGRDQYQSLLNSKNYVTRRQSLKLLGELLLDRHNFNIMTKYISNPDNMKLMMELLRDKSRNIQYEAFHVFKVFVANPNKPKPISDILLRNREKLVEFLGEFHNDRTDDEQFNDEKAYLVKQIQEMKATPKEPKKSKTEGAPESSEASPSPDQQQ